MKKLGKRQRRIEIIRQRLLRKRRPRLQVSLILSLTGLAGFLTSSALLHLGVDQMAVRYPVAIGVAYSAFLTMLALWLWLQRHVMPDADVDGDLIVDVVDTIPGPHPVEPFGGDFGGGGAGGSFAEGGSASLQMDSAGSIADSIPFDMDLEELGCLILAALALLAGLLSTFYIVYIAPSLLAEILIDGALVAGLYRRVKRIEEKHWLSSAISRTALPAFLTALFLTIAAIAMQKAVPEARTMGDVWRHIVG